MPGLALVFWTYPKTRTAYLLTILENLREKTKNAEHESHPLLLQKVKENDFGRKNGRGFPIT